MRKLNLPLVIGGLILTFIIILMIVPEAFTDKSPYTIKQLKFIHEDGKLDVEKAPFEPSDEAIMGSDDLGRDIYSFIIYGTKLTISLGLLIALAHFMIAIPIAMIAGFGNSFAKNLINQSNIIFSAIPGLLINVIILQLAFFFGLDKTRSIIAFVIVITLTGWPKLASLIEERVEAILAKPFITGEIAIGKSRLGIGLQNVFPHLVPELLVLLFMEVARSLSMIMQLGLFSVFIGNLRIILSTDFGRVTYYDVSFEPEWASMLASSRTMISVAPWTVLYPALAFFISVLGFNLFGEGLREMLQKKNSKIIPHARQALSLNVRYFTKGFKTLSYKKLVPILAVITLFVISLTLMGDDYRIESLTDLGDLPDQAMIGSSESVEVADYIAKEMDKLGIRALEESLIVDYEASATALVESGQVEVTYDGRGLELDPGSDYAILAGSQGAFEGKLVDFTSYDLYSLHRDLEEGSDIKLSHGETISFKDLNQAMILIDSRLYNDMFLYSFMANIRSHVQPEGFVFIGKSSDIEEKLVLDQVDDIPLILVSDRIGRLLCEAKDANIKGAFGLRMLGQDGRDVLGIYPGGDPYISEEAILIGMSYNYLDQEGRDKLALQLDLMKNLCSRDNKRSLIFVFADGTYSDASHGIHVLAQDFPYSSSKIKAYIDMTGIKTDTFSSLNFSTKQAPVTRQFAWSIGHYLTQEFERVGVSIEEPVNINRGGEYYYTDAYWMNTLFWDRGVATIHLSSDQESLITSGEESKDSINRDEINLMEVSEILLKVISMSNY